MPKMSDKANIDPLAGRTFALNSGNFCRVYRIAERAIRVVWEQRPSAVEEQEFLAWVGEIRGYNLNAAKKYQGNAERVEAEALLRPVLQIRHEW